MSPVRPPHREPSYSMSPKYVSYHTCHLLIIMMGVLCCYYAKKGIMCTNSCVVASMLTQAANQGLTRAAWGRGALRQGWGRLGARRGGSRMSEQNTARGCKAGRHKTGRGCPRYATGLAPMYTYHVREKREYDNKRKKRMGMTMGVGWKLSVVVLNTKIVRRIGRTFRDVLSHRILQQQLLF